MGKSRAAITNTLRLFQLPPAVQKLVVDGQLSAGHARALLGTPDRAFQEALARKTAQEGLSVRSVEEAVRARGGAEPKPAPPEPVGRPPQHSNLPEPGVAELEDLLATHLNTRVKVDMSKGTGHLHIEFADLEDLERIYRLMIGH